MANLSKFANKVAQEAAQFIERKGGSLENKTEQMILKEAQEAGFDLEQAAQRHSSTPSLGSPEEIANKASSKASELQNPIAAEATDISQLGLKPENIQGKSAAVKSPIENAKDLTKAELEAANTPEAKSLLDELSSVGEGQEVPQSLMQKINANKGKVALGAGAVSAAGYMATKPKAAVKPTEAQAAPEADSETSKEEEATPAKSTSNLKAAAAQVKAIDKAIDSLPEDKRSYFDKQKELLETSLDKLRDTYADDKKRIGLMEAIETVGKGLLQIGAGIHGIKTGVDMSGVKFNPVNWTKQYELLKDELKIQMDELSNKRQILSKQELTKYEEENKNARESAKLSAEERMANARNKTTLAAAGIKSDTTKEVAGAKAAGKAIGNSSKDLKQQKQAFDYVYNTLASGQYDFNLDKAKKRDKAFNKELAKVGLPPDLLEQTWSSKGVTDFSQEKRVKTLLDAHKRALDAKLQSAGE